MRPRACMKKPHGSLSTAAQTRETRLATQSSVLTHDLSRAGTGRRRFTVRIAAAAHTATPSLIAFSKKKSERTASEDSRKKVNLKKQKNDLSYDGGNRRTPCVPLTCSGPSEDGSDCITSTSGVTPRGSYGASPPSRVEPSIGVFFNGFCVGKKEKKKNQQQGQNHPPPCWCWGGVGESSVPVCTLAIRILKNSSPPARPPSSSPPQTIPLIRIISSREPRRVTSGGMFGFGLFRCSPSPTTCDRQTASRSTRTSRRIT